MFKNMGENIPRGNFPGGNFPEGSLMGGNFPGGSFPDTVLIFQFLICAKKVIAWRFNATSYLPRTFWSTSRFTCNDCFNRYYVSTANFWS